jgi:hypothetical protein
MSATPIDFDRPEDDLYRDADLRHVCHAQVLGIPVRFEANSEYVLGAVEHSFGERQPTGPADQLERQPRVRVFLQDGDEGGADRIPVRYRWPERDRLVISTPGSVAVAEVERRDAYAFVTARLAADAALFQYAVLESLTLMLVTGMDRQPVHAAAIAREEMAVLLVGPSGSGKSTLTYAALKNGWRMLGEEAVYVQLEPSLRVWGMPRKVRLPSGSEEVFPELKGCSTEWLPNGKQKIVLPVKGELGPGVDCVDRAAVCLIDPAADEAGLHRVTPAEIERMLSTEIDQGFDMDIAATRVVAARLAEPGGWVLGRAGHPADCVALLDRIVDGPA